MSDVPSLEVGVKERQSGIPVRSASSPTCKEKNGPTNWLPYGKDSQAGKACGVNDGLFANAEDSQGANSGGCEDSVRRVMF